jgi:hypothetical protein
MQTALTADPQRPAPDVRAPDTALSPARRSWYRPTGGDLVFLALVLVVVQTARQGMLDDPGLGWHLRNVDAMWDRGGWLTEDPFSASAGDQPRPWYTNQWLAELPLWLGERWAGLEGIAAAATLVLACTLTCLYGMLLRDGLPWPGAVAWTALAAMATSCSWAARPNLFTMLFVLLTARACVQFHSGRLSRRGTLWLLPLFAAWANMHGGFVAGLILLGATLAFEAALAVFALDASARRAARGRAVHLALLSGGAFLATLLNPYGLSLYRWVLQLLGNGFFMDLHQEWKSPDFHSKGAMRYELLLLLFPLLLGLTRRRPNLVELGLSVLWLHLALTGFRYVPLWVLVATPLLARSSAEVPWLRAQARRLRQGSPDSFLFLPARPGVSWLWISLVAAGLLGWAKLAEGRFARHQPEMIPSQALDRLLTLHAQWRQRHGREPVVFHHYNWGGYLTWHGWPAVHNRIDDRNEVQGEPHVREYFAIVGTDPGWQEKLARVDLIAMNPEAPLSHRLAESGSWRECYRDRYAVLFEHTASVPAAQ